MFVRTWCDWDRGATQLAADEGGRAWRSRCRGSFMVVGRGPDIPWSHDVPATLLGSSTPGQLYQVNGE